ncbi:MAG: DUF4190 domain-containing protein [Candidatus Woesearchaeota archaeon]
MAGKTSGLAIASLVFGILSFILGWVPILGWLIVILAIVFGIIALVKISKDPTIGGKGMAIAGIVLGGILLAISVILMGVGALAYFGVLSPQKLLPDKCLFGSGVGTCTDFQATENGLSLTLTNDLGEDVVVNNVEFGPDSSCTSSSSGAWPEGETLEIKASCSGYKAGEKASEGITISYTTEESDLVHSVSGQLMATIQ